MLHKAPTREPRLRTAVQAALLLVPVPARASYAIPCTYTHSPPGRLETTHKVHGNLKRYTRNWHILGNEDHIA
ncbi:hypothetical protein DFP73DRAFT_541077 [Morchella snyderi]|nr:hypothetical protein DFP73DRAFT_541077 [Morchella snyderi]